MNFNQRSRVALVLRFEVSPLKVSAVIDEGMVADGRRRLRKLYGGEQ
jgi:hypothetical protein